VCQIRNSAKAVIINNGRILLIKNKTDSDLWYLLPGGGQHAKENLHDTLKREVIEECGINVNIEKLFLIREYIGKNHEFGQEDKDVHGVEFMFLCDTNSAIINPTLPDRNQISADWIDLKTINETNLYPKFLKKILFNYHFENKSPENVYVGDIN